MTSKQARHRLFVRKHDQNRWELRKILSDLQERNEAKEKSAFITTEGLFQFKVLPFGLATSPAVFQRLMHLVLGDILTDEVFCYLDDIMKALSNANIVATMTEEPSWTMELRKDSIYGGVVEKLEQNQLKEDVIFPNQNRKYKSRRIIRRAFLDAHASLLAGHFGPRKVLKSLEKRVLWESMRRDVLLWSEECKKCVLFNTKPQVTPPLKPIITTKPFEVVGIDILEMGLTTHGNRECARVENQRARKRMNAYDETKKVVERPLP
ncbi:hypothetical protein COOONC_02275 [Cooperia oncophora]